MIKELRLTVAKSWVLFFATFLCFGNPGPLWAQTDPQGALDSFYLECGALSSDTLVMGLRFSCDNTDSNKIVGFGMPVLITVSNDALVQLDTTLASTFAGSMVERFAIKSTATDTTGGADPSVSPVHFVMGAVALFDSGVTGTGLFANLKLVLNGDSTTITLDTLSTALLTPSLVTEVAVGYTPGWSPTGFGCGPIGSVKEQKRGTGSNLPRDFSLGQNYPNPFNATTVIEFTLPRTSAVNLQVFNILGQKVVTLVDETLEAGYKQVAWDGKDQKGNPVASGVYFYRLRAGDSFSDMKKMQLVR